MPTTPEAWQSEWTVRIPGVFDVGQFGAVGDGVSDDAGAIQRAINNAAVVGGQVVFGAKIYFLGTTLQCPPSVRLSGVQYNAPGLAGAGTLLFAGSTTDIINLSVNSTQSGIIIEDLCFVGGQNHITSQYVTTFITVERCFFRSPAAAGIYITGCGEEWRVMNCFFSGGQFGFFVDHVLINTNQNYFDKSVFHACEFTGMAQNAVKITCLEASNVVFRDCIFNFCRQHGVYLDGGLTAFTWSNINTESNGFSGPTAVISTGSMTSGSTTLTTAGTGYNNGDVLTVASAGSGNLTDLTATVSSGGGTNTLILSAAAGATVTNVAVTSAIYDDLITANSIATPSYHTFDLWSSGGATKLRYVINWAHGGTMISLHGRGSGTTPIYAPAGQATVIGKGLMVRDFNINAVFGARFYGSVYVGGGTQLTQSAVGLMAGNGAPGAFGNNGDLYLRGDGGAGTTIYQRRAGAWVGIV